MNTYHDINFLIPDTMAVPTDIKMAFVYSDDIKAGRELTDHLNSCKLEYCGCGLVHPYNAAMLKKYVDDVMQLFKAGVVCILICTDAAGMVSTIFHELLRVDCLWSGSQTSKTGCKPDPHLRFRFEVWQKAILAKPEPEVQRLGMEKKLASFAIFSPNQVPNFSQTSGFRFRHKVPASTPNQTTDSLVKRD